MELQSERDPLFNADIRVLKSEVKRLEKQLSLLGETLNKTRSENLRFQTNVVLVAMFLATIVFNVVMTYYIFKK